ncbi:MAG: FecR domain-containing protein [Deltaproteobacteria bacterium]|nr:FecR domain-containing protein [Deltaproteobacteria bacterium]
MKKSLVVFVVALAVLSSAAVLFAAPRGGAAGTLSFYTGEVMVQAKGAAWRKAGLDAPIYIGDTIRTGADSTAELTLSDGSILRMGANGRHRVEKASFAGKGRVVNVFSTAGRLWVNARTAVGKNSEFKVSTDKAVCAIRGTAFDVNAQAAETTISVFEGRVETWAQVFDRRYSGSAKKSQDRPEKVAGPSPVAGPTPVTMEKWVQIVAAMQRIRVDAKGGFALSDVAADEAETDSWLKWNRERDRMRDQLIAPEDPEAK